MITVGGEPIFEVRTSKQSPTASLGRSSSSLSPPQKMSPWVEGWMTARSRETSSTPPDFRWIRTEVKTARFVAGSYPRRSTACR